MKKLALFVLIITISALVLGQTKAPSSSFTIFRASSGAWQVAYPNNWKLFYSTSIATVFTPKEQLESSEISLGVFVGFFKPEPSLKSQFKSLLKPFGANNNITLDDALVKVIKTYKKDNPYLSENPGARYKTQIAGQEALATYLTSRTTSGIEKQWWLMVRLNGNQAAYLLCVTPKSDFSRYEPAFKTMATSFNFQPATASSNKSTAASDDSITIRTPSGPVRVKNLYKFGTTLQGSNQVELRSPNGKEHPWYISFTGAPDNIFYISPPLLDNYDYEQKYGRWTFYRDESESDFLGLLGISRQDACNLNVELGFAGVHEKALAETYGGKNFGLSFCPNGIPIPPLTGTKTSGPRRAANNSSWVVFWTAFRSAVQRQDRKALRGLIAPEFEYASDALTADKVFAFLDSNRGHDWVELRKILSKGVAPYKDYSSSKSSAARICPAYANRTGYEGYRAVFELGKDGRWRWTAFAIGD